jgi:hypothetical protein
MKGLINSVVLRSNLLNKEKQRKELFEFIFEAIDHSQVLGYSNIESLLPTMVFLRCFVYTTSRCCAQQETQYKWYKLRGCSGRNLLRSRSYMGWSQGKIVRIGI